MTTTDRVLEAILARYAAQEDLPLTIREIQEAAGLSSSSVAAHHVRRLERAGLIRRSPGISRSIRPAARREDAA